MSVVAVVLAGGKGTRSADPTKAKLGQVLGGHSIMEWHLRLLEPSEITDVVVVAGHLGGQVQSLCDEIGHRGMSVSVIHEKEQRGTVSALRLAADQFVADEYLVILGDILISLPIDHFLQEWRASDADVAVVVHPSTHPEDSDAAFPNHSGDVLVVPKSQPREGIPNMSSAGLFGITRGGLTTFGKLRDFGSDVLREAAERRELFAYISSHYLKDTGTPARLSAAQADIERGAFQTRGNLGSRPALLLDRDGVINPIEPEFYRPDEYELNPGVAEAIAEANRRGIPVVVVTNQPHIAKGLMTFDDHDHVRARMDRLLGASGAFVDDYIFCPHHPESGHPGEVAGLKIDCTCRKPGTGLALFAAQRHRLDLKSSVMVGDTDRDRQLAERTGMRFVHVRSIGECPEDARCFEEPSQAIRHALELLAC